MFTKSIHAAFGAIALIAAFSAGGADAAPAYDIVTSFHGGNGAFPLAGAPVIDSTGNIYVTTYEGGANSFGTVNRIAPDGTVTVLHVFDYSDGGYPAGGVLYDEADGRIVGAACTGGPTGHGVLYSIAPDGSYRILHKFDGVHDGSCPVDAPAQDPLTGTLYGVASAGGPSGDGTVWRLTSKGAYSVLHTFNHRDGSNPQTRLIRNKDGTLYGTTADGGAGDVGTVFSISPKGKFATLHSFASATDGAKSYDFLTRDRNGNLYGTTFFDGPKGGGTVFKLAPDGTYTVIKAFANDAEGGGPESSLALLKGKLYGTTAYGGDANCQCGVVFEMAMDGSERILHAFTGDPDGLYPFAGLVQGPDHSLYGDTEFGGADGAGSIFRVKR